MDRQSPNRFWFTPDRQIGLEEFCCRKSCFYPPRFQDEYVVVIPLSGEIWVQEENRVERVSRGNVLVGNSRQWRGSIYGSLDDCHGLTLIAGRRLVQSLMMALGRPDFQGSIPLFPGTPHMPRLVQAAEGILAERHNVECGRDYLLELLVREALVRTLRSWPDPVSMRTPQLERVLTRQHYVSAISCMQECGKSAFSVAGLGHMVGLSPEEFTRLFRASTGATPLTTYNRLLIHRATNLFGNGASSVKEVASLLEFESASHFSSMYRRVTGQSPTSAQRRSLNDHAPGIHSGFLKDWPRPYSAGPLD